MALRNTDPSRARTTDSPIVEDDSQGERFRIYRLCPCEQCEHWIRSQKPRCPECRGEGKVRERVAECATEASLGVALVTLGREGEFKDCAVGILDTEGEVGQKWIVSPWLPSPRNVSEAGRVLASAKKGEKHEDQR